MTLNGKKNYAKLAKFSSKKKSKSMKKRAKFSLLRKNPFRKKLNFETNRR